MSERTQKIRVIVQPVSEGWRALLEETSSVWARGITADEAIATFKREYGSLADLFRGEFCFVVEDQGGGDE